MDRPKSNIRKLVIVAGVVLSIIGVIFIVENTLAMFSGTPVMVQPIQLEQGMEMGSFNITGAGKHRIDLKMRIYCFNYHKTHEGEKIGEYHYPYYLALYDDEKTVVSKEFGVVSSDSDDSMSIRHGSSRFRSGRDYETPKDFMDEQFSGLICQFNSDQASTYYVDFSLNPDEKYDSQLVYCELIVKENIGEYSVTRILLGWPFLGVGIALVIVSTMIRPKRKESHKEGVVA